MNKKILGIFVGLLVLAMFVVPVMAKRPKLTYSLALVSLGAEGGITHLSADKILHTRNAVGNQLIFGSPWGDGTGESTGNLNLNIIDLTGNGEQHNVDTYATGTIEGSVKYKITGVGMYMYDGPTFTYNGFTVVAGMMFPGLLFSGITVKHGASGELEGLQMRGTWAGVAIQEPYGPPALWGVTVIAGTGTYW